VLLEKSNVCKIPKSYEGCRILGWGGVAAVGMARRDAEEFVGEHAIDFAFVLLGIAMRIEFGLNVGTPGPFPEEVFHFFFGAGFFEGEALLLDGETFGGEIAAAHGSEVVAEIGESAEFDLGVFVRAGRWGWL